MSNDMLDKLKEFLDSEEGKKSIEEFAKELEEREKKINEWVENFNKLSDKEQVEKIKQIIETEEDDHLLFCYAEEYGLPIPGTTEFTVAAYAMTNGYDIECLHGQGTVYLINKRN